MSRRFTDRAMLAHYICRVHGIPHEHQVLMHEDQVISLIERDHWPKAKAEDGTEHFSNAWGLLIAEHREKTRKLDVPGIAKRKRIAANEARHQAVMREKLLGPAPSFVEAPPSRPRPKRRIPSRPFEKRHRPLRRVNFQREATKGELR